MEWRGVAWEWRGFGVTLLIPAVNCSPSGAWLRELELAARLRKVGPAAEYDSLLGPDEAQLEAVLADAFHLYFV